MKCFDYTLLSSLARKDFKNGIETVSCFDVLLYPTATYKDFYINPFSTLLPLVIPNIVNLSNTYIQKRSYASKIFSSSFSLKLKSMSDLVTQYPNRYILVFLGSMYLNLKDVLQPASLVLQPKGVSSFVYMDCNGRLLKVFAPYILIDMGNDIADSQINLDFEIVPNEYVENWLEDTSALFVNSFDITNENDWLVENVTVDVNNKQLIFANTYSLATYLPKESFGSILPKILSKDYQMQNGILELISFDVDLSDSGSDKIVGIGVFKKVNNAYYSIVSGYNLNYTDTLVRVHNLSYVNRNIFDACLSNSSSTQCCLDRAGFGNVFENITEVSKQLLRDKAILSIMYSGITTERVFCNRRWINTSMQSMNWGVNLLGNEIISECNASYKASFNNIANKYILVKNLVFSSDVYMSPDITNAHLAIFGKNITISNIKSSKQIFVYTVDGYDIDLNSSAIINIPVLNYSQGLSSSKLKNSKDNEPLPLINSGAQYYKPEPIKIKELPKVYARKKPISIELMVLKQCQDVLYANAGIPITIKHTGRSEISYTIKYTPGKFYSFVFESGFIRLILDESKSLKTRENVLEGYLILQKPFVVKVEDENGCVYTIKFEPAY